MWKWNVIVKSEAGALYDFKGRNEFSTKKECVEALNEFLHHDLFDLLRGQGEIDPESLEMVDMTATFKR